MRTLRSADAENSTRSPHLTSRELYNFVLCLVAISMTVELPISVATVSDMPMNSLATSRTTSDILENAKYTTRTKFGSYSQLDMNVNHYNDKIELTGLTFDRNAEGVYAPKGSPLVLAYSRIDLHGDGWIQLVDEAGPRLVEEDAQTISNLIDQKIREAEIYGIEQRKSDLIGDTDTSPSED